MKQKFQLGHRVYAILGGDQDIGIVTGITQRPTGFIYLVTWQNHTETPAYDIELSEEPVRNYVD